MRQRWKRKEAEKADRFIRDALKRVTGNASVPEDDGTDSPTTTTQTDDAVKD